MGINFRKLFKGILIAILGFSNSMAATAPTTAIFTAKISSIPPEYKSLMTKYTWQPGCPVSLEDLAYVKLSYWGFDNKSHIGTLIIHKKLAKEVVNIFHELYNNKYPIERMEPLEAFKGEMKAAMAANNTSGFICQKNEDGSYFSHSYGNAIDINSLLNPYIKGHQIFPANGRAYLNRNKPVPGMIIFGDKTYELFKIKGWDWGGSGTDSQNYQHFEKNCNKAGICPKPLQALRN